MGRTPCCAKEGLNRGPWTPDEDLRLSNYVETHGEGGWRTLPKKAGLLRCGKSCRLRWMNYLRPDVKRGKILPDEEDLILRLHRLLGNRWSLIAGRMPGRTDNEVKNYWNTHLSKKLITQGIDPRTHKPLSVKDNLCDGTSDENDNPDSPVQSTSPVNENTSVPATATENEGKSPAHTVNDINSEASCVPLSPALDFSIDNQYPLLLTLVNSGDLGTPFEQNEENLGSNQATLAPFLNCNSGTAHHQRTEDFNLDVRRQWSSSQASVPEDLSFQGCGIVPTSYNKLSNTNCSHTAFNFSYPSTASCMGSGFGDCNLNMFSSIMESYANEEWAHVTCAQNPANLSYDLPSLLSPPSAQFHPSK
ncbi:hypothetical protein SUGI_0734910 [Cryptomeria japonica]|uniref:transcription repressor MYB5 n=1 Tax=Cryptomeria japonica TaxID=3369 RepID=UPI0024149D49|nr:transcription repressor MYB5 [Cryptomeria japonica]GLJ36564.1 hypothetical protein SUGI_0734910 [Cryptomeria japonica]